MAATNAVRQMNTQLRVEALEHFVAPHTEHIFNDGFWNQLDVVTNALDNVKARLYVDSKCVFYRKPLLESGTLGTKCNVQVVIPELTASYADGPKDSEDDQIPMCTLRNFPSLIEHCIEWARAQFEDVFVAPFGDAKKFCSNPELYLNELKRATIDHPNAQLGMSALGQEIERLERLLTILESASNMSFESCLEKALALFHSGFRDRICQLVHNFPEDHVTSVGEKFWSGAKRFPQAAVLDMGNNDTHVDFVMSAANIFAVCFGLHPQPEVQLVAVDSECRDASFVSKIVASLDIREWTPSTEKVAQNDAELREMENAAKLASTGDMAKSKFLTLVDQVATFASAGYHFEPADFEKDQDLNFHIDFITAASNLRAWNYRIQDVSRHKCKMIAGVRIYDVSESFTTHDIYIYIYHDHTHHTRVSSPNP